MIFLVQAFEMITSTLAIVINVALWSAAVNVSSAYSNINSDSNGSEGRPKIWIRANREGPATELTIEISSDEKIGAVQFELIFPVAGDFQHIEPASLLSSALMESNIIEPGRLRVAVVSSEALLGSGEFATLRFGSLPVSNPEMQLRLENVKAWHLESLAEVPVKVEKTIGDEKKLVGSAVEASPLSLHAQSQSIQEGSQELTDPAVREEIRRVVFGVLRELDLYPPTPSAHLSGWVSFAAGVFSTMLIVFLISNRGKQ
jgi:hypothetical protein